MFTEDETDPEWPLIEGAKPHVLHNHAVDDPPEDRLEVHERSSGR
jgi:hypothetical protein